LQREFGHEYDGTVCRTRDREAPRSRCRIASPGATPDRHLPVEPEPGPRHL